MRGRQNYYLRGLDIKSPKITLDAKNNYFLFSFCAMHSATHKIYAEIYRSL